jgi:hypothetical protein
MCTIVASAVGCRATTAHHPAPFEDLLMVGSA